MFSCVSKQIAWNILTTGASNENVNNEFILVQISSASHFSKWYCSNLSLSRRGHKIGQYSVFTVTLFLSLHLRRTHVHKYMQHDGSHSNAWNTNEMWLDSNRKAAPFFWCLWAEFTISALQRHSRESYSFIFALLLTPQDHWVS